MATASNIVINDGATTPVAHTFVPIGADSNGVFWFDDQSASNAIGYNRISLSIVRPKTAQAGESSSQRVIRVKVGIHTPVLETLSNSTVSGIVPAPTVSYVPRVTSEYILPERSTVQNRKDLRSFLVNLHGNAQLSGMIDNFVSVY